MYFWLAMPFLYAHLIKNFANYFFQLEKLIKNPPWNLRISDFVFFTRIRWIHWKLQFYEYFENRRFPDCHPSYHGYDIRYIFNSNLHCPSRWGQQIIRGGGGMQPSRKQCTNGTYNPNFALKFGIITPW